MKVLLAYRCTEEAVERVDAVTVPAGLPWMAAAVRRAGHEALVANFSRLGWKDIERYLASVVPDLVGMSCLTSNRTAAARMTRVVRRTCPNATIAMGGPHASILADLLLRRLRELDCVVVGEGEAPLLAACAAMATGGRAALASLPGIAVRGIPAVAPSSLPHPDELPRPVVGLDGAGLVPERDLRHVVASRARPTGPARRSARSVVSEIEELRDEFGVVEACLVGPGLLAGGEWLADLAAELQARRVAASWELSVDVSDLAGPSDEVALGTALQGAHAAGCRRIRTLLDASTADAALARPLAEASRTLREAGIAVHATLRHGVPGKTTEDVALLRTLVRALRPREGVVESLEILPATPAWDAFAAAEGLDERFWFDESRPFIPAASDRELEVSEGALGAMLRDVARSSRPASRDLEILRRSGRTAWGEIEWGDWRASLGDMPEAERRYRAASALERWNPFPWLRLASLFARKRGRRGDPERSGDREAAALRQVLARVPRHAPSRARLDELVAEAPPPRRRVVARSGRRR